MTRLEFAQTMAYIATAINKPLSERAVEVYFDLLGDLPLEVCRIAAKRVVLEHRWATFPTVAELRQAAAETIRGEVQELCAAEAWRLAWHAVGDIDLEVKGKADRVLAALPPIVAESMQTFGIASLCYGKEPVSVIRGQFVKIFEQLAERDRRVALLPVSLGQSIARIGSDRTALIGDVEAKISRIGIFEKSENGIKKKTATTAM